MAAYILAQATKAKHNHVNEWIHIKTSNRKKDATSVICDAEGDANHPNREEGRRRDDGRCCGDGGVVWIVAASLQKVQRVPGCLATRSYLDLPRRGEGRNMPDQSKEGAAVMAGDVGTTAVGSGGESAG